MTKRILNAEKSIEEKAKPVKKEAVKLRYRVAVFNNANGGHFVLVAVTQVQEDYLEKLDHFVRWEPAVEVEV